MKTKAKSFFGSLLGLGVTSILEDVSKGVKKTIDETEKKISLLLERLVKKLVILFMVFVGLVYVFAGLVRFLNEQLSSAFIGYFIVGGVLLLLGWFAKYLTK
ncbi:MAG: hypothetical protein H6502_04330 [Candidatus Woesearchaeota archaeon]|nr:MAG: hypothetical protein H6502_04330 [Candidatus Woesearchaeota archaeon]